MCSLYFCFGPGLTGPHPTLCCLCSQRFFVLFCPGLTGTSPALCFLPLMCSFFLLWSGPIWDPTHPPFSLLTWVFFVLVLVLAYLGSSHPLLSLLSCVLSFCFGPGLTGTYHTPSFLSSLGPAFLYLRCIILIDIGVPIASSCYRCIEITHILHLMCPFFVIFESQLN